MLVVGAGLSAWRGYRQLVEQEPLESPLLALAVLMLAVVTNGYDEDDFAGPEVVQPAGPRIQILHAGQLNPERPAEPFLRGLCRFLSAQPRARERVQVRFVGPFYENDVRFLAQF